MTTVKGTFSLDPATVDLLNAAAQRLNQSKSAVVRTAIRDFHARLDRLSEAERLRLLAAFDELVPQIPERPAGDAEREIREIRASRRRGGRRTPAERLRWRDRFWRRP